MENKEEKKNLSFKRLFLVIIIVLFLIIVVITIVNIMNAKNGKRPIFYFSQTVNIVDGSLVYNIFPYKITEYRNRLNSDSYIEISMFFERYMNQFYDPKSSKYIFEQSEYIPPVFDANKQVALIEDIIEKVNIDAFSLGTNSNYANIYIDTTLSNDNKLKLIEIVNDKIQKKYQNKNIVFKSLEELKNENILLDDKIIDGIYLLVTILENKENEDIFNMQIITNVSTIFSQRVVLENKIPIVFRYSDDFDEQARKQIIINEEEKKIREEQEKALEEIRKKQEQFKQEQLIKQEQAEFNEKQNRLQELFNTITVAVIDGKKGLIQANTEKTILNKDKDLSNIVSYNIIRINNERILYQYQEQIEENQSINIFVKEKQLTEEEFNSFINNLNIMTGYTGTGQYQNSFVINIEYLNTNKNILLKDLNEILKEYNMII